MPKLRISKSVLVRMEGSTTDENGADQPFKVVVLSTRQDVSQMDAHYAARRDLNDLMGELTTECREQDLLEGDDGELMPANMDTLAIIRKSVPHIGAVWWESFVKANGAKAKQGN